MKHFTLETCVDSVESALNAEKGGANRLELCSNLIIGGTTPTASLYKAIRRESDIRIHALIRPRFGDFCYSSYEVGMIAEDVAMFRELGAEGVVIGALRPDGELDMDAMGRFMEEAKGMSVTLHRAFDVCADPFRALEQAKELGINTILTSGQENSCRKGKELLRQLVEKAEGKVDILVGAGVDAEAIAELRPYTKAVSFHMSGKITLDSAMTYRKEGVNMGLPSLSEFEIWQTDVEKIKAARKVLEELE